METRLPSHILPGNTQAEASPCWRDLRAQGAALAPPGEPRIQPGAGALPPGPHHQLPLPGACLPQPRSPRQGSDIFMH